MAAITDFFCGRLVYIRRGDEEEDEEDPTILLPPLSPAPHPHPLPSLRQMTLTFVSPSCGGGGDGKGKRERRRRSRAPKNGTNTHGRSAKKRPRRERIAERTRNTKTFCFLRIALPCRPQEKREGTDQTTSRLGQSKHSRRENNGSGALAAFRAAVVIIHAPCGLLLDKNPGHTLTKSAAGRWSAF